MIEADTVLTRGGPVMPSHGVLRPAVLGLHRPTSGETLIGNRRYDRIRRPMREVGPAAADRQDPGTDRA